MMISNDVSAQVIMFVRKPKELSNMSKKVSRKNEVREKITSNIMDGNFDADSIITEKQLIDLFSVSKTTIREALVELCIENVLENLPRFGYRVVKLTEKNIEDAQYVRMLLELNGFDKMIGKFDSDHIQTLKEYIVKSDETRISGNVWTHWQNNIDFHILLNSFAGNSWMNDTLIRTLDILSRAYAQSYWNQWGNKPVSLGIELHLEIVEYLENGQFDLARKSLEADIQSFGL